MSVPLGYYLFKKKDEFTPKRVKISDIYKHATKENELSDAAKTAAAKALEKAGYAPSHISKIVYNEKDMTIKEMKDVATHLNADKVRGFDQPPKFLVNSYLTKERVKKQTIARYIQERASEAQKQNLDTGPKISFHEIKPSAKGPGEIKKPNLPF